MSVATTANPNTAASGHNLTSPRLRRILLLIVIPLVAGVTALAIYLHGGRFVATDNAYVKADKIPVSAEISGTIKAVLVRENQTVAAGQVLFRLDPAPFAIALAKAEARLAQVRADLLALQASYREKEAEIALADTRRRFARKDKQRAVELTTRQFISALNMDKAEQAAALADQEIAALTQDLRRIAATLGGSIDAPIEQHPSYLAALADLEQARLDLARAEVRAVKPGTVTKTPKTGQFLAAGSTALVLVVDGDLWIEANFTETDLTHVRPGQPVSIQVDTFPDVEWQGRVESLSPATGAEFSVIPAQNATGNWVKISQRVPVRIHFEQDGKGPPLRAGLSTHVEIDTGHRRSWLGISG